MTYSESGALRPRYHRGNVGARGRSLPQEIEENEAKPRTRASRVLGLVVAFVLVAAGVAVMMLNVWVREFDTSVAGWIAQFLGVGEVFVMPESQSIFWQISATRLDGVQVTVECTSAFLIGPTLVVSGLVLASGRFGIPRVLFGLIVASSVLFLANWTRISLVIWATANWGFEDGYQWSHTVAGSLIVLVGVLIASALFIAVLVRRSRRLRFG